MSARVLVIEDNPANLKLARELLVLDGYEVLTASDAVRGLELARHEHLDLVLMDIQLPGMDGLTATRLLKADPRTRHVPVIALTAHAMRGDEERMLSAGCDRYISKPIRYKSFLAVVREVLAG